MHCSLLAKPENAQVHNLRLPAENQAMQHKRSREPKNDAGDGKKKRKTAAKPKVAVVDKPAEESAAETNQSGAEQQTDSAPVGSGRQAAQGMNYTEKASCQLLESKIAVKQEQLAEDEAKAVQQTETADGGFRRYTFLRCDCAAGCH